MDNPLDNVVDLGFVNYTKHPENPQYIVFRFSDPNRASSFEEELLAQHIWFEKAEEQGTRKHFTLFGIHQKDFKNVEKINYRVEGKHKKPIIPFRWFRYFLFLFSTVVMILAVIGYCEAQKKIQRITEKHALVNNPTLHA